MADPDDKIVQIIKELQQIFEEKQKKLVEQAEEEKKILVIEHGKILKEKEENEIKFQQQIQLLEHELNDQQENFQLLKQELYAQQEQIQLLKHELNAKHANDDRVVQCYKIEWKYIPFIVGVPMLIYMMINKDK